MIFKLVILEYIVIVSAIFINAESRSIFYYIIMLNRFIVSLCSKSGVFF